MPTIDFETRAADYVAISQQISHDIASAALKYVPRPNEDSHVLDLACGRGDVTRIIMENAAARGDLLAPAIVGLDISPTMVKMFKEEVESKSWTRASAKIQDAQDLSDFHDDHFDLVFMNFGIMFVPDPIRCTKEVFRVLKLGGYAIFTTWKEPGVPHLLAKAADTVSSTRSSRTTDGEWGTKEKLISTLTHGGFKEKDIQVEVEQTKFQRDTAEEIAEALSVPSWNPQHDGTHEATRKWKSTLLEQMTPAQRDNASIDMIAWVGIAMKKE
ncbi:s-adenosyl-l-methionine-dependent methyltransferase [Fusarium flagelliforme]|uniref:S-adenosyl-l-methionine-dependent methyltransferase n=1 Tax=Fusarium flagelliforme TaxID=2675880 RepID=A0A395MWP6_9HYPO|nr:s-adenosyl-l-methionine-dependent methyltransferase [Fusarium flagelliforme]